MTEHLLDHVRPYLDQPIEHRVVFIRSPRWIGYDAALKAQARLRDLLVRPPSLRTRGVLLVGPYANGKTMIAERFAIEHLRVSPAQKVWVVQTREGAGLSHFYASILYALKAPLGPIRDVVRKAEQLDRLLTELSPRVLIFDEFHNALRGRSRDVEAIFAFLRRLGRSYDISPVLIGEVAVHDYVNATDEMASRFELCAVPRWSYGEDYLALLDSFEAALPLAEPSDLSDEPMARRIFALSEGLIGEVVKLLTAAAVAVIRDGHQRITPAAIDALRYLPLSARRQAPARQNLL
jgi:SpoVK/Ycf46/Vps4 family AAA+-type ATPase